MACVRLCVTRSSLCPPARRGREGERGGLVTFRDGLSVPFALSSSPSVTLSLLQQKVGEAVASK